MCTSMYWICIFLSLCVHLLFQSWITVLCVWPQNDMWDCIITIIQLVKIAFLIYQLQPLYHHQWSKGKADIFYACCALNVTAWYLTAWYLQTLLNFKELFPSFSFAGPLHPLIPWHPPPNRLLPLPPLFPLPVSSFHPTSKGPKWRVTTLPVPLQNSWLMFH